MGSATEQEWHLAYDQMFKKATEQGGFRQAFQEGAGALTACWSNLHGAGVFESTRAKMLVDMMEEMVEARVTAALAYASVPAPARELAWLALGATVPVARRRAYGTAAAATVAAQAANAGVDAHSKNSGLHDPAAMQRGSEER